MVFANRKDKHMKKPPKPGRTASQVKEYRQLVKSFASRAASAALREVSTDWAGWQRVVDHNNNKLLKAITKVVIAETKKLSRRNRSAEEDGKYDPLGNNGLGET